MGLIDEYDTIMDDVMPFLSLPPQVVLDRVADMGRKEPSQHTIVHVRNGTVLPTSGADWRQPIVDDWNEALADIAQYLPDLNVAVHLHDGPMTYLDWNARQEYMNASREGRCQCYTLPRSL